MKRVADGWHRFAGREKKWLDGKILEEHREQSVKRSRSMRLV
jgi:hypothetical protein